MIWRLLQAAVIRIGELEHQLDMVCRNVSSLLCKDLRVEWHDGQEEQGVLIR